MSSKPRRRALPATEWAAIQKDITSGALASAGKAPAATAAPSIKPPEPTDLPKVEEAQVEEITLPRKCACVDVTKCGCQTKADTQVVEKPLPAPTSGEDEQAFVSRCMGDAKMNSEYPDEKQRSAICYTQFKTKGLAKADVSLQTDAPPDKTVTPDPDHGKGVMLALWVPPGVAKSLALPGGETADDMHVTLGYFGKLGSDLSKDQADLIYKCASDSARTAQPIKGKISGVGRFTGSETSDGKDVMVGLVDAPGLGKFRHGLMEQIAKCSNVIKSEVHDFTPHVTLKYVGKDEASPVHRLDHQEVNFAHLVMAVGGERKVIPLGEVEQVFKSYCEIVKAEARLVTGVVLQPEVVDAQGDIISEQAIADAAHAFVANYNSRTKIGVQHSVPAGAPPSQFPEGVHMVESYIAPAELVLNGRPVKKGTWMMTVFVESDELWDRVKAGKIRGFSIGGIAKVQRIAA